MGLFFCFRVIGRRGVGREFTREKEGVGFFRVEVLRIGD